MQPAGWIPPQFRELVYADKLEPDEVQAIRESTWIVEYDENGKLISDRPWTDDEINQVRRVRGVRDTRDGSYHPNKYFKD